MKTRSGERIQAGVPSCGLRLCLNLIRPYRDAFRYFRVTYSCAASGSMTTRTRLPSVRMVVAICLTLEGVMALTTCS